VAIDIQKAVVYDVETTLVVFTMHVISLYGNLDITFEISIYRDDRVALLAWFEYWRENQTPMIGFNNIAFDYPVIHFIYSNPDCTVAEIYEFAQERIRDHAISASFGKATGSRRKSISQNHAFRQPGEAHQPQGAAIRHAVR
jgi:hypothetical protein